MGLLLVQIEEIFHPLEVIGDIIAVLIKNLNAGDLSLTIGLELQSEHVIVCIRDGIFRKIKAVLLEAVGHSAQTLAGAGTGLNGLVQSGALELLFVEFSYKLINRFAVCSKAGGILVGVEIIDLGIILGRPYLHLGRPHLTGQLIRDESIQRNIIVALGFIVLCPYGYFAVAEKQIVVIIIELFEHQFLDQQLLLVLARQGHFRIGIVTLYGNESIGGTFDRAVLIVDFLHFNIELLKTAIFIVELRQLAFVLIDGGLGGLSLGALAAAFAAALAALAGVRQNDLVRVGQGTGGVAAVAAGCRHRRKRSAWKVPWLRSAGRQLLFCIVSCYNTSCNVFQGVPSALSRFMVSYKKSVVKHSMGTFGNATKSH